MAIKAVLLGASGVTGGFLLQELIAEKNIEKIYLLNRRELGIDNAKVEEIVTDLFDLENFGKKIDADVMFVNIGSTKAKTPDLDLYRKIDFGIPVGAAKLAKKNGIDKFMVVSSLGANADSSNFYSKMKGDMQEGVKEIGIKHTYILQPSLIESDREEKRVGEKIAIYLAKAINPLLVGKIKKYRSIKASVIGKAMAKLAFIDMESRIIESDEIQELGA